MRRKTVSIATIAASVAIVLGVSATPAHALSYRCTGECTTDWVWANQSGRFVDVYVENPWNWGDPRWCSWKVRDYDNGKTVASGHVIDEESDSIRVPGLYGRYRLYVSNSACWGQISDGA